MTGLVPLIMLWLATRGSRQGPSAPAWPTPSSPPPIPAFRPKATPTPAKPPKAADASHPATPLAALHAKPPTPPPAEAPKAIPKAALKRPKVPFLVPGRLTSTVPVSRLQKVLVARGAKLIPDGKYGPKTAAAWTALASAKKLPGTIRRKGPTTAEVLTHTLDALSVPAIP